MIYAKMKEGNNIRKLLKYGLITIFLFFIFLIWYNIKFSTINVLNSNCNLSLPKPKSVDTIIQGVWQDDSDFDILYYKEKDIDKIKDQINNHSMEVLNQKLLFIFENITSEEREKLEKYFNFNESDKEYLYYAYFQRKRMGTLIIFDEKNLKLYYLNVCVKWTLD